MEGTLPLSSYNVDEESLLNFFSESGSELESPVYLDGQTPSIEELLNNVQSLTPIEQNVQEEELQPLFPLLNLTDEPAIDMVTPTQLSSPSSPMSEEEQSEVEVTQKPQKKTTRQSQKKRNTSTNQKPSSRPSKKQKVGSEFLQSLQGLTSDELTEYERTHEHELTTVQSRELKNWIRKIKNRESALLSRQRKKTYQEELEQRIEFLKKENVRLEKETMKLEAQNSVLKDEFVQFQNMISSSTFLSKMFSQMQHPRLQNAAPLQNPVLQNATPMQYPDLRLQYDSVLQNIVPAVTSTLAAANVDISKLTKAQTDISALVYLVFMLYAFAPHYATLSENNTLQREATGCLNSIAVQ